MPKITPHTIFSFILCITLLIHSTILTITEDESLLEPEINADIMSTEPDTEEDTDSDDAVPEKGKEEIAVEEAEATQEEKEQLNEVNFAITPFVIETLSPSEAVVTTFDDLYTVLSQDNGITTVYLGSDIDIKAGGIALHKNKTSVIIDGISPLDATGTKHKLSEYTSSNYGDCIRVTDTNGTKNVTLRNLVIVGRNYYGTVYISDSVSNVVITYESVEYKGPQITYNTKGTARYIDTSIVIDNGNGGSPRNEVAEIRYVEFGGTVSIYHYSTVNRLFYLWGGAGSITVLDGADVNIIVNDASISLLYGNATDFIIGTNASFVYSGKSVFNENSITSLTVKEGGRFSVISTGASLSLPVLYMTGDINVKEGAGFEITANSSIDRAIIRLGGNLLVEHDSVFHVIASNGFYSLINVFGGTTVEFRDPASVIFYNKNNTIVFYDMAGNLIINAQQINYWDKIGNGGLDNPPLYGWKKANGTNFTIIGKASSGISGNFTTLSSNYTLGDFPGNAPDSDTFNLAKAKMLSFGRLEITAEPFYEFSTQLAGATSPNADISVEYTSNGALTKLNGKADSIGNFVVSTGALIEYGTVLVIKININYLTAETNLTVERISGANTLEFLSVPNELLFETTFLSSKTKLIGRQYQNWHIVISDTRGIGGQWRLTSRVIQPFTPVGSTTLPILNDALVFVDESGAQKIIQQEGNTLIYEHTTASLAEETVIGWDQDKGLLAEIQPGSAYANQLYYAVILWMLESVP